MASEEKEEEDDYGSDCWSNNAAGKLVENGQRGFRCDKCLVILRVRTVGGTPVAAATAELTARFIGRLMTLIPGTERQHPAES